MEAARRTKIIPTDMNTSTDLQAAILGCNNKLNTSTDLQAAMPGYNNKLNTSTDPNSITSTSSERDSLPSWGLR